MATDVLQPDHRGRFALGRYLVEGHHGYRLDVDGHGVITLTPIAATLTPDQLADLQADPIGFVEMMNRAAKKGDTVPVGEFFDNVDNISD